MEWVVCLSTVLAVAALRSAHGIQSAYLLWAAVLLLAALRRAPDS